ncbi:MAG TPA: hypothetical protein DEA08_18710 [Planctomycetes bacterium]|nr:hypothetical protein [Planctomycetota bacterium]|tara:strand:- start:684 stop:956 length:273 start_codon:yes stop_codon:yes gene_type:complete
MKNTVTNMYVTQVVDGDPFHTQSDRIRLQNADASEIGEPGGAAAKRKLASLVDRRWVQVAGQARDVYGRLVAEVHVDVRSVNAEMRAFLS